MNSVVKESWFRLSLPEQMVNIGNEVKRAVRFDSNAEKKTVFLEKALALTELTMEDPKNQKVLPELEIGREVLMDYNGKHELDCPKERIQRYYMNFAFMI